MTTIFEKIPELACCKCKSSLEGTEGLVCTNCGAEYSIKNDIPCIVTEETLQLARDIEVQDKVAIEYEQKRYQDPYSRKYHDWWTSKMLSCVKTDGRILDNGCGIGLLFNSIPDANIVGLDLSIEMLRKATKFGDKFVLGNSEQLPFKDNSFDMIFCRSLIHHLSDPDMAVKEMHRVLKPGGEVVMVETNRSILSSLPRKIANKGEHFSEEHKNLSKKVLVELFKPYFNVDQISYFGYIAYPIIGFPDLITIFKYFPFKPAMYSFLMSIDNILSKIPFLRTQSWAILIKATKKNK